MDLDPDFAALVETADYHVFLTPRGAASGWLYVQIQTSASFTVNEIRRVG